MDGALYETENFDFFKDMMKLKFYDRGFETKNNIASYNVFNSCVILTKEFYNKILVIPEKGKNLKKIISSIEESTKSKLKRVKSNGNKI